MSEVFRHFAEEGSRTGNDKGNPTGSKKAVHSQRRGGGDGAALETSGPHSQEVERTPTV